ncbi:hypothetical protein [Chitinophaga parva]|uniref:hypothetical protein n=1 Tax=Chitinophaga parva TaxID=2169414 RepID=UPI0010573B2A|nr:hypothetical protein [Chitinophaga parva]
MRSSLLLPHRFKLIGWCLLALGIICYLANVVWRLNIPFWVFSIDRSGLLSSDKPGPGLEMQDIALSLAGVLAIVGSLMVGYSREKQEDEFIARIRLTSLQWAVLVNQLLLVVSILVVWDMNFMIVMLYNIVTIPLIFIVRFNYLLLRYAKQARHEK